MGMGIMRFIIHLAFLLSIFVVATSGVKRYYITRWGACSDCGYSGKSYQWCTLGTAADDWDYCSSEPGYSYKGDKCSTECGHHGYDYMWCGLENGGWGYCSSIEDFSVTYYNYKGKLCHSYCDIELSGQYECRGADNRFEVCSLISGMTIHGKGCRPIPNVRGANLCTWNNPTTKDYRRCRDGPWASNWDYCGVNINDELDASTNATSNASTSHHQLTITQTHTQHMRNGVKLVTYMGYEPRDPNKIRQATSKQRRTAHITIMQWHNQHNRTNTVLEGVDTIAGHYSGVRLDRLGHFNRGDVRFANLQLQIEWTNSPGLSIVARVNFEIGTKVNLNRGLEGIAPRGFRRFVVIGLTTSLRHSATTWVYQELKNANNEVLPRL